MFGSNDVDCRCMTTAARTEEIGLISCFHSRAAEGTQRQFFQFMEECIFYEKDDFYQFLVDSCCFLEYFCN